MSSVVQEIIDVLTTVAVGILTALLMTSIFIFLLVYKRNKNVYKGFFWNRKNKATSDVTLIKPISGSLCSSDTEIHLENLSMHAGFEKLLEDERWLNEISDLMPHCLGILKNCRCLTEKLATLCMGMMNISGPGMRQIVECARQISTRIDDMVAAMYPPLNPQLLEARASSLRVAVNQLALIAKYEGELRKIPMDWMDSSLEDIDTYINLLRDTASSEEIIKTRKMEKSISVLNF